MTTTNSNNNNNTNVALDKIYNTVAERFSSIKLNSYIFGITYEEYQKVHNEHWNKYGEYAENNPNDIYRSTLKKYEKANSKRAIGTWILLGFAFLILPMVWLPLILLLILFSGKDNIDNKDINIDNKDINRCGGIASYG